MIGRKASERGSALLLVVIISIVLVGVAGAYLALSASSAAMTERQRLGLEAMYCAESATALAVAYVNATPTFVNGTGAGSDGVITPGELPAVLQGQFGTGGYNITIALWGFDGVDNNNNGVIDSGDAVEDDFLTVTAQGYIRTNETLLAPATVQGDERIVSRQVECILGRVGGAGGTADSRFALFQGGSTSSNAVVLNGNGSSADTINGNVYINGNLVVTGEATINPTDPNGTIVSGSVTDASSVWDGAAVTGTVAPLDLSAMNYSVNHDYNINNALATGAPGVNLGIGNSVATESGVRAPNNMYQVLDPNNPAHIFRRAPDGGTFRGLPYTPGVQRYYFEDPTHEIRNDPNWDNTSPSLIETAPGANIGKIYYIKGDLYIHSMESYSYRLFPPGGSGYNRIVVVVEGNIRFSDNLFYNNAALDGLVLVAMKDPARPSNQSGNIFQGDLVFGTTEAVDTMVYAENNYQIDNLGSSTSTNINGNVAAGNHIIQTTGAAGRRFLVNHDTRRKNGLLPEIDALMPPDPMGGGGPGTAAGSFAVRSWRQLSPKSLAKTTGYKF